MCGCVCGGAVCVWDEVGSSEGPKWENLSIATVAADVLEWLLLWNSDRKGKFSHSFISFSIAWGIGPQLVWISYFSTCLGCVQTCWVWPLVFFKWHLSLLLLLSKLVICSLIRWLFRGSVLVADCMFCTGSSHWGFKRFEGRQLSCQQHPIELASHWSSVLFYSFSLNST